MVSTDAVPRQAGVYVLIFQWPQASMLPVGRLGEVLIPAGWILYAGSAKGPGGLRARLRRHFRRQKRPHWHVDALSQRHPPVAAVFQVGAGASECVWAQALAETNGVAVPAQGFGSSDCRQGCVAHLFAFKELQAPLSRLVLTAPPHSLLYCEHHRVLSPYPESALMRGVPCDVGAH